MSSNDSILKRAWLLPLVAITIAAMALAYWAVTSNRAQAADADDSAYGTPGLVVLTEYSGYDGITIPGLEGTMHKAAWKDLVVDVSLECGLSTDTQVESKGGKKSTATASAGVQVQVLANGVAMEPGWVTFCRRSQELSATFQGLIENPVGSDDDIEDGTVCLIVDPITHIVTIDQACIGYEQVGLLVNTTNANAFNFVHKDDIQGDYKIEVQARMTPDQNFTSTLTPEDQPDNLTSADALATIGKGSAIAMEVRFAKTKTE